MSIAKRANRGFDLGGVLGGDGDLFAAEFDRAIDDGRFDFAISGGRDGDDVGELEVGYAKLGELADEPVGLGAADAGLLRAKFLPREVEGLVSFGVADLLEAGYTSVGAVVGKSVEGLFPAYPGPDGHRDWGFRLIIHNLILFHRTAHGCAVFRAPFIEGKRVTDSGSRMHARSVRHFPKSPLYSNHALQKWRERAFGCLISAKFADNKGVTEIL